MPTPRLTLASLLERLSDPPTNPQVKTLLVLLLAGLGLWLMSLDKLPTRAAAFATARQAAGRGIVIEKRLTLRKCFALGVMSEGRLVQPEFWEFYYPPAVAADSSTRLSYEDLQRLALTAYARVGDSLVKKPGSLVVQVKRGATTRTFQYRNPYS